MPHPKTGAVLSHWCGEEAFRYNHAEPGFSAGNARYRDGWRRWLDLVDHIGIYCYYGHYAWATPFPMLTQMANDFPIMADSSKFDYVQGQLHAHWGTQGITFYVLSKLAWNPYADVDALIHDYCSKGFGPAGPAIERYFRTLQAAMDDLPYVSGEQFEIPNLLTPELTNECNSIIEQAESHLGSMDPATHWRTMIVTQGWRASALVSKAAQLYINSKDLKDGVRIVVLLEEAEQILNTEWGILAFDTPRAKEMVNAFGRRTLSVPLSKLPSGEHLYNDQLIFGGATKFFGEVRGFNSGQWGLSLDGNQQGQIHLPIKAANGHHITSAKIEILTHLQPDVAMRLLVGRGHDHRKTVAEGLDNLTQELVISDDLVGGSQLLISIEAENRQNLRTLVFTGLILQLTVD